MNILRGKTMTETEKIIKQTVEELKRNKLIRTSQTSVFQKTEKILYIYPDIIDEDEPFLNRLNKSLKKIECDPDYEIIELKYFKKLTHEEIAELLDVDPKTVTRRKNKIIKRLSFMLFPSEAINELINE